MTHPNREELARLLDSYSLVASTGGMAHALRSAAAALRQSPSVEEVALKDAAVVHINMLRGGIAKPTPTQIGHLYRGEEAAEVVREVVRQNPDIAQAIAALYGRGG